MDQVDINLERIRRSLQRRGLLGASKLNDAAAAAVATTVIHHGNSTSLEPNRPIIMPQPTVKLAYPARTEAEERNLSPRTMAGPTPPAPPEGQPATAQETSAAAEPGKERRLTLLDILLTLFGGTKR